jgi:hypothetical protein
VKRVKKDRKKRVASHIREIDGYLRYKGQMQGVGGAIDAVTSNISTGMYPPAWEPATIRSAESSDATTRFV